MTTNTLQLPSAGSIPGGVMPDGRVPDGPGRSSLSLVAEVARSQHGVFTRAQATAAGLAEAGIRHQLEAGHWLEIQRGVYATAFVARSWMGDLTAAHLGSPGSVVSHEAAAQLHGIGQLPRGRLVLTVPRHNHHVDGLALLHESTDLSPAHVVRLRSLPVTSVARTVLDLAAVLSLGKLARVVDEVLTTRKAGYLELATLFGELNRRGKRGYGNLRLLLDERGSGLALSESELESRFLGLLVAEGIPLPVFQYRVPWRSEVIGRVDSAYPDRRLLVELDGRRWHSRDGDHDRDRRRDNEVQLHGWRIVRFTWRHVVLDPAYVVTTLGAFLDRYS